MPEDQHGLYHAIPIQSGSIALRISVEDFGKHSLVPWLNLFGKLYHGTVTKQYFDQLFQEKKQEFFKQLKSPDAKSQQFVDFRLRMARLAQSAPWKWPAFVNLVRNEPEWATGNGRILASGLCKKNPQHALSVVLFDQVGMNIAQWIDNPVEITTDEQLHRLLNLPYTDNGSALIQLSSILRQVNGRNCLFLHGIIDEELAGYQNSQELSDLSALNKLLAWRQLYPRPTLAIYTDWPELIVDSENIWDYHIAGSISQFSYRLKKPGHLEKLVRLEDQTQQTVSHRLYVRNPCTIDLTEFLVWMDNDHTAFVEQGWNFLLHQTGPAHKTTIISFSTV